jgi:hypothetical protein
MLGKMIIAATVAIFLGNTAAADARPHARHHGYGYWHSYGYGYGRGYGYGSAGGRNAAFGADGVGR